jgi:hypothetical protein
MKVYVVVEFANIEYEEYTEVMGVFSSETKAKEAISEYENNTKDSSWRHEYNYFDYEVDKVWEQ